MYTDTNHILKGDIVAAHGERNSIWLGLVLGYDDENTLSIQWLDKVKKPNQKTECKTRFFLTDTIEIAGLDSIIAINSPMQVLWECNNQQEGLQMSAWKLLVPNYLTQLKKSLDNYNTVSSIVSTSMSNVSKRWKNYLPLQTKWEDANVDELAEELHISKM